MTDHCQCNYCSFQVTEEDFEKMSHEFTAEVVERFFQQTKGFRNTEINLATTHNAAMFHEEVFSDPHEDEEQEDLRVHWLNALASCYESPVYFYDAMRGLQQLIPCIEHALNADSSLAASPILTKIITPEIFLNYFLTREFPEEIKTLLDKLAHAEVVTETQQ